MTVDDTFRIVNAHSKGFERHDAGDVKFVTNGFFNNGVVGFVSPLKSERVFEQTAICVSAFCEATVQEAPFLPRGNGGSGLIVLLPKKKVSIEELYHYAAQINLYAWRFSFGRMVIGARIKTLPLVKPKVNYSVAETVAALVPKASSKKPVTIHRVKEFPLLTLVEITRQYAPYLNQLDISVKRTPYVTTTELNNGISLLCNEDPLFKAGTVTVSLDGICGTSFYQFRDYMAGEKTAVLTNKTDSKHLMFYVAALIKHKSWRYHYGRKLSMTRLRAMTVPLPVTAGDHIDYEVIETLVSNSYGWDEVTLAA